MNEYWKEIDNDLYVISHDYLEDFRAVMGAKTSRSLSLENRISKNEEELENFLSKNVAGYGHASIGDMSFCSIFARGFGWITAGILMDTPLFNGQEVSTRAVDLVSYDNKRCEDDIENNQYNHDFFSALFLHLKSKNDASGNYKYDTIRWAMPGTFRTGVMSMMNTRALARQLDRMKSINFCSKVIEKYVKGAQYCSKHVFNALYGKNRNTPKRWTEIEIKYLKDLNEVINDDFIIIPPVNFNEDIKSKLKSFSSRTHMDMLDDTLSSLGLFKVIIRCPIYESRDWKRHRTAMPWISKLIVYENAPMFTPKLLDNFFSNKMITEEHKKNIELIFHKFYNEKIADKKVIPIESLYALPLGSLIEIEGYMTFDHLVYMLELRANAHGVNIEYKNRAIKGLNFLNYYLDIDVINYFKINKINK